MGELFDFRFDIPSTAILISDVGSDGQLFAVQQTYIWNSKTIIGLTNACLGSLAFF